jgi:hypothetical protein
LADRDTPVIFLSTSVAQDLAIKLLAQHLAELFDSGSFAEEVELLLTTDDAVMDALLVQIFQVPIVTVPADSSMEPNLENVPDGIEQDLRGFADATEEIFEDAMEEIFDSEAESFEDAMEEPTLLEEIEVFEDAMEEILENVESLKHPRQHPNESEIPTVQISVERFEDYTTAISIINGDFQRILGRTAYKDLNRSWKTGFAGEFLVLSHFLDMLTLGLSLIKTLSSWIFGV